MKGFLAVFNLSLCLLAFAAGSSVARADSSFGPDTAQLNINLNLQQGCRIENGSVSAIDFGTFVALDNPRQAHGTFTVNCDADYKGAKTIKIRLDAGKHTGDKVSERKLYNETPAAADDALTYQVYIDSNHSTIWGDGTNGTQPYSVVIDTNNADKVNDFYLELFKQDVSNLHTGVYSNVLTMTIDWD